LVAIGLASLALAALEYRQSLRILKEEYKGRRRSLAVIVAGLIAILGIVAMALMIYRS
jgi:uncharacterized membrane protein YidH (DUF202 family)